MYRADRPAEMKPIVNGTAAMSASGQFGKSRLYGGIGGHADIRLGDGLARVLEAEVAAGDGRFRGISKARCGSSAPIAPSLLIEGWQRRRPRGGGARVHGPPNPPSLAASKSYLSERCAVPRCHPFHEDGGLGAVSSTSAVPPPATGGPVTSSAVKFAVGLSAGGRWIRTSGSARDKRSVPRRSAVRK
jgi:hypothetical protein